MYHVRFIPCAADLVTLNDLKVSGEMDWRGRQSSVLVVRESWDNDSSSFPERQKSRFCPSFPIGSSLRPRAVLLLPCLMILDRILSHDIQRQNLHPQSLQLNGVQRIRITIAPTSA